jgi:hypothetical protein
MIAPFALKPGPMSAVLTALPTKRKPTGAFEKMLPAPGTFIDVNEDLANKNKPAQDVRKQHVTFLLHYSVHR